MFSFSTTEQLAKPEAAKMRHSSKTKILVIFLAQEFGMKQG